MSNKQILLESKKKIKLHELSDLLKIKKSTIKNWEKEFNLPFSAVESTQKSYSEQEIKLIKLIKKLLYDEKLSYQEIQEKIRLFLEAEKEKTFNPAQSTELISPLSVETTLSKEPSFVITEKIEIENKCTEQIIKKEITPESLYELENIKKRLLALKEKLNQ